MLAGSLAAEEAPKVSADLVAETGAKFRKNCMSCHVVPDLRIASDRAWLSQIRETA